MNKMYKLSMFFLSYTPLWISIIYIDVMSVFIHDTQNPWTEILSVLSIILGYCLSVFNMICTLKKIGKENSERCRIVDVQEEKTAATEYVLTFVLPMFAFEFTQWENIILFLIYFFVLGYLCMKHNLLVSNIIMEVIGYRFYNMSAENDYGVTVDREVISKERLTNQKEEFIFLHPMNDDLYCDVTTKQ